MKSARRFCSQDAKKYNDMSVQEKKAPFLRAVSNLIHTFVSIQEVLQSIKKMNNVR